MAGPDERLEQHLIFEIWRDKNQIKLICKICDAEILLENGRSDANLARMGEFGGEHNHRTPKTCVRCAKAWDRCFCMGGPRRGAAS